MPVPYYTQLKHTHTYTRTYTHTYTHTHKRARINAHIRTLAVTLIEQDQFHLNIKQANDCLQSQLFTTNLIREKLLSINNDKQTIHIYIL